MTEQKNITIPYQEYIDLKKDSFQLVALHQCGVDNWEGFEDAEEVAETLTSNFLNIERG